MHPEYHHTCSNSSDEDMDIEQKQVDFFFTSGQVMPINLIQSGAEQWQRVGRHVILEHLKIAPNFSSVDGVEAPLAATFVVYDMSPNGVLPTISTIFNGRTQAGVATGYNYWINPDYADRFFVLYDSRHDRENVTNYTPTTSATQQLAIDVCLCDLPTHYKSDSSPAVIGDIATGALYICNEGNNNRAVRLYYRDINNK